MHPFGDMADRAKKRTSSDFAKVQISEVEVENSLYSLPANTQTTNYCVVLITEFITYCLCIGAHE